MTPTSVRYRLDDPTTGCELVAWTTGTPGTTLAITITGAQNVLNSCASQETRELTVEAVYGGETYRQSRRFWTSRVAIAA